MLRRNTTARLAFHHSPEREQRIVSFAKGVSDPDELREAGPFVPDTGVETPKEYQDVLKGIDDTRRKIFLGDLKYIDPDSPSDIAYFFSLARNKSAIEQMIGRELSETEVKGEGNDAKRLIDEVRNDLYAELMQLRPKQYSPQTYFPHDFADVYRTTHNKPDIKDEDVPPAFMQGKKIFINPNHRYRNEVEKNRVIKHELAHYFVDNDRKKYGHLTRELIRKLGISTGWKKAKELVQAANGGQFTGENEDYAHEVIAIYLGGRDDVDAYPPGPRRDLCRLVQSNPDVPVLLHDLVDDVHNEFEFVNERLTAAAEEQDSKHALQNALDEDKKKDEEKLRDSPTERAELHNEINDDIDKKTKKVATAADLQKTTAAAHATIQKFRESLPRIESAMKHMTAEEKRINRQSLASINQFITDNEFDVQTASQWAKELATWEKSEADGGPSLETKRERPKTWGWNSNPYTGIPTPGIANKSTIDRMVQEADAASKAEREQTIKGLAEFTAGIEQPFKTINEYLDRDELSPSSEEDKSKISLWKKLQKNVFSSGHGVEWMSMYDIVKLFSVHKEAWLAKYKENQERRVYRMAKNTNFRPSLQPTLDKQARAANEKQTHDFLEFLKTSGLDYDALLGKSGLYWKLTNINEQKAVLEFAAGKAWLYDLNKLDGHNVYGIDYIREYGPEQFEELVQSHEGGKAKMVKEGIEKVDKEPDVPQIMKIMTHELHHKNIYVVQGIMQKLQDKAKYSHSNTWMLTTLLMLIRDESAHDPELMKCLDKGMIDNISNHTIQQSAWSVTWLKMKRHEIDDWKRGKAEFGNNIVTKTMERIEQRLKDAGANFPNTEQGRLAKYEAIGMVLAGKTLHEGNDEMRDRGLLSYGWKKGMTISIFENEFTEYRTDFINNTAQATCAPSKTDNDYFNSEQGGSDVMLLNTSMIKKILIKDSTGQWTNGEKAEGFMAQVFDRHEELGRVDRNAQLIFEQEMRSKISGWWMGVDASRKPQFPFNQDQKGRFMYEELLQRNLLNRESRDNLRGIVTDNMVNKIGDAQRKKDETKRIDDLFKSAQEIANQRNKGD